MPLQIRVRHALGERLMELPDRTVEGPVVVGRSASSDVQIPSVNVVPRHWRSSGTRAAGSYRTSAARPGPSSRASRSPGRRRCTWGMSSPSAPRRAADDRGGPRRRRGRADRLGGRTPGDRRHAATGAAAHAVLRQRMPHHPPARCSTPRGAAVPAYGATSAAYGTPPAGFSQAAPGTGGWPSAADGDTIDMSTWQSSSPPTVGYSSPSYRRRKQGTPVVGILVGLLICAPSSAATTG